MTLLVKSVIDISKRDQRVQAAGSGPEWFAVTNIASFEVQFPAGQKVFTYDYKSTKWNVIQRIGLYGL